MERLFIIFIFLRVTVCGVCSAAAFQNDLWSHIGVSTDTEVHFIEIPSMFSCRTPFCCYDLQPSLHCSPVTITYLEIVSVKLPGDFLENFLLICHYEIHSLSLPARDRTFYEKILPAF